MKESLIDLDHKLKNLCSGVLVVFGQPEIELLKLVNEYSVQSIYAQKEIAYEEIKTEKRVQEACIKNEIQLITTEKTNLYSLSDLPFSLDKIPDIFTEFRKRVEKESQVKRPLEKPTRINSPKLPEFVLPSFADLNLEERRIDSRAAIQFKGGESEAWNRLKQYFYELKSLSKYKETRNGMIGSDYSSKFSAWLALGCISPRSIYQEIRNYESEIESNESTYWLFFELLWREYFQLMIQKYGNQFFQKGGIYN